jgi:Ca2+-binding RTX toxin-like protein
MRLLLLALVATLLLAAPASAARFQHNGADIDFTTGTNDVVKLTATGHKLGDPKQLTFTRGTGATPFTSGAGCSLFITTGIATCGVGDDTRLRLTTNERPDTIDASGTEQPFDASVPEIFDTKGGNDTLIAGPLADTVSAGSGDDAITGGPGADQLRGDAGNDTFTGLTAGDLVDGGNGVDLLDLSRDILGGVSVSLDGIADDGPLGSDANVIAVETVRATPSADILIGGTAAERFEAGDGADTIDTRGGGADSVDCGPGVDVAQVDELDQVTGCETVELPPAGNTDPSGGVAPGGAEDGSGGVGAGRLVDADRDGVLAGADCDDSRDSVRPGARDIPGNGIDEDCSGGDAKRALAGGRLSFEFLAFRNGTTKPTRLLVRDLPGGGCAVLHCKGGGCAFRTKAGKPKNGAVNLRKLLKRRLRAGAVLEVRLSAPDATTRVIRFTMRKRGLLPKRRTLCLAPGAAQPGRCV